MSNARVNQSSGPLTVSLFGIITAAEVSEALGSTPEQPKFQMMLRQVVSHESTYQKVRTGHSLQDSLFDVEDFGDEAFEKFVRDEKRVAWIPIPSNATVESIQAMLDSDLYRNARCYRMLGNQPFIADTQVFAIESPDYDVTYDTYANNQCVRFPDAHENWAGQISPFMLAGKKVEDLTPEDIVRYPEGHEHAGLINHIKSCKLQYRTVFFASGTRTVLDEDGQPVRDENGKKVRETLDIPQADIDQRDKVAHKYYSNPELLNELAEQIIARHAAKTPVTETQKQAEMPVTVVANQGLGE